MPYVFNYEPPSSAAGSAYYRIGEGARSMYDEQQDYERRAAAAAAAEAQRQFDAKMRMQAAELQAKQGSQQANLQAQYQQKSLQAQTDLQKQQLLNQGYLQTQELRGLQTQRFPTAGAQILQGIRDGSLAYTPEQEKRYAQLMSGLNQINSANNWKPAQRAQARNMIFQELQTLLNNPAPRMQKQDKPIQQVIQEETWFDPKLGGVWYRDKDGIPKFVLQGSKPDPQKTYDMDAYTLAVNAGIKAGGETGFNEEVFHKIYNLITGKNAKPPAGTPNPSWGTGAPQIPVQPQQPMLLEAPAMEEQTIANEQPPQVGESPFDNPSIPSTFEATPYASKVEIKNMISNQSLPQQLQDAIDWNTGIFTDPVTNQKYRVLKTGGLDKIEFGDIFQKDAIHKFNEGGEISLDKINDLMEKLNNLPPIKPTKYNKGRGHEIEDFVNGLKGSKETLMKLLDFLKWQFQQGTPNPFLNP